MCGNAQFGSVCTDAGQSGGGCRQTFTYTRTGCKTYSATATSETGLTNCRVGTSITQKVECSSYYNYTGQVSYKKEEKYFNFSFLFNNIKNYDIIIMVRV